MLLFGLGLFSLGLEVAPIGLPGP